MSKTENSTDNIAGEEQKKSVPQEIRMISLKDMHEFAKHPYRVVDDGKMEELVDSIKENGVLVPGTVRPRAEGGYEIVSGHRRRRACELAGLTKMPMFVKDLSDEDAILEMVDSNIQRENISHSEKAKAYQMRYNAMKGKNPGVNSLNQLAAATGENKKQIQRYVWLARLTDDLLRMVDEKKLPFIHGVNLSFLKEKEQSWVYDQLKDRKGGITAKQTELLKIMSQTRELTKDEVKNILSIEQPVKNKKRMIQLNDEFLSDYFDVDTSDEDIKNTIIELLTEWKKREGGRDAKAVLSNQGCS